LRGAQANAPTIRIKREAAENMMSTIIESTFWGLV